MNADDLALLQVIFTKVGTIMEDASPIGIMWSAGSPSQIKSVLTSLERSSVRISAFLATAAAIIDDPNEYVQFD